MEQMKLASRKGTPPMRPLFFDFADDKKCAKVDDQFLFGPDLLGAPILISRRDKAKSVFASRRELDRCVEWKKTQRRTNHCR
ncbi:MAG: hypothetical protein ACREFE_05805 [Limisphaerales bacterium]